MGLRPRQGKWHYRFEVDGHEWTGNTGLAATERNRTAAQSVDLEAQQLGVSPQTTQKIREQFAGECKRMLEGISKDTECTCGAMPRSSEHDMSCPVDVFRRAAHAVWLKGQP